MHCAVVRTTVDAQFRNRRDAGQRLAERLSGTYAARDDVIVLGLARGGVPVAEEVAKALGAQLDVFMVRKLGVPGQEELAMGAIASGGMRMVNREVVSELGIGEADLARAVKTELRELERRERLYRSDRQPPVLRDRTVILVDDGLATGMSMRVAVAAVGRQGPAAVVVAVPVAPAEVCGQLARDADSAVCIATPEPFVAVGLWYEDFAAVSDDEIRAALERAPTSSVGAEP